VRGELLVDFSADLLPLLSEGTKVYVGDEKRPRRLARFRRHGKMHLISFQGLSTRTQADAFRDRPVRIRLQGTAPLPPNVYYHWQILGLRVETEAGEALGHIAEILQTGANDVYVIHDAAGEELLIPAIEDVIRTVDLPQACMVIRLLPGLRAEPGSSVT
jgi:16S rRNA processing protein RimM